MIGLLMKDLYLLRQNAKSMLFVLLIWSMIFLGGKKDGMFLIPMFIMVAAINGLSLFAYDRQTKWETYVLSMPVMRGKIVLEKYVFTVCSALLAGSMAVVVVVLSRLVKNQPMGLEFLQEVGMNLLIGLVIAFLYNAISFPLAFWLGVEKARVIPGVIMGAGVFLFVVFASRLQEGSMSGDAVGLTVSIGAAVAAAVVMVISCMISAAIYEKKEF